MNNVYKEAVKNVGGLAFKGLNPAIQVKSIYDSAKGSARNSLIKQNEADSLLGVSGNFSKLAAAMMNEEKYKDLYTKKKKMSDSKKSALMASGATIAGLTLYGGVAKKDPLWAAKTILKNKKTFASKAVGIIIKNSPFKDTVKYMKNGIRDGYSVPNETDKRSVTEKLDDAVKGGTSFKNVLLLGLTAGAGKEAGKTGFNYLKEKAIEKKLKRDADEKARIDAYTDSLSAEDLFKKASIASGDDIVTAVNKSVEKFLPDEIKKREERRNRYNTNVDYVDNGAHGGDAPQRRNK